MLPHCPFTKSFAVKPCGKGDVEAFTLLGHPKAQKAHAWSEGQDDKERFFAVLELPPVKSATDAVRASIVADAGGKK